jgi:hypothetical protein
MAALTDLSDLLNRGTGGNNGAPETPFYFKAPRIAGAAATAPIAGRMASLWRYDGMPGGGAIPTTRAIPTRTTQGAFPYTAAGGGREKFALTVGLASSVAGVFTVYDRLFHIGGLSGAVTTAQTVQGSTPTPALTRNTGGVGNVVFVEIYTQIGNTAQTITMNYTNQAGTTGRISTAVAIGGSNNREATRVIMLPLQGSDTGVRAVESVTLSGSTAIAGEFGVIIARPFPLLAVATAGMAVIRDWTTGLPMPPDVNDMCLSLLFFPASAAAPDIYGGFSFVEK